MRWQVNHKRVYRLYGEEGLAMAAKSEERLREDARPLELPLRPIRCGRWISRTTAWPMAENSAP